MNSNLLHRACTCSSEFVLIREVFSVCSKLSVHSHWLYGNIFLKEYSPSDLSCADYVRHLRLNPSLFSVMV